MKAILNGQENKNIEKIESKDGIIEITYRDGDRTVVRYSALNAIMLDVDDIPEAKR